MSNKVEVDKELLANAGQIITMLHNLIESGNQPYVQTRNTLHAARELHKIIQAACDAKLSEAPPSPVVASPHVLTIEEKIVLEDQLAAETALEDEQEKAREEEEAYLHAERAKARARYEAS